MGLFSQLIRQLPMYLLAMPVILIALSVHESAHGYAAYKLGDPTARNLGRITLNPIKHFDIFGFICMLVIHIGWAKPVPINARHFKNPRRDMAITGAAGPLSNLALAVISFLVLRIGMIFLTDKYMYEAAQFLQADDQGKAFVGSLGFTFAALTVYLLYLGVVLNISLAIFNLIPVPPFDGSRIFYAFLPPKVYFGVMRYERIIMIVLIILLSFGFLSGPLQVVEDAIIDGLFTLTGMKPGTASYGVLASLIGYVGRMLSV